MLVAVFEMEGKIGGFDMDGKVREMAFWGFDMRLVLEEYILFSASSMSLYLVFERLCSVTSKKPISRE